MSPMNPGTVISVLLTLLLLVSGCGRDSADALIDSGIESIRRGDYKSAASSLERAAKRDPASASAYCNLGIAYWRMDDADRAVSALTMAADLDGRDPRILELLGYVLGELGRWHEARAVLKRANDGLPDRPQVLAALARVEYHAGDLGSAREYLEKALDLAPTYAPALYNMGVLFGEKLQNPSAANQYFTQYLNLSGADPHAEKARAFLSRGKPKPPPPVDAPSPPPAVTPPPAPAPAPVPPPAAVTPAPPANDDASEDFVRRAGVAIGNEQFDEALVLLKMAIEKDPRNAEALWTLAVLYDKHLQDKERAAEAYASFAEAFPSDPRAASAQKTPPPVETPKPPVPVAPKPPPPPAKPKELTSRQQAQKAWHEAVKQHSAKNWRGAIESYKRALAFDGKLSEAAYNMGLVYKIQGDLKNAQAAFEQTVSINPGMIKAHYMLAVVLRDQKKKREAIERGVRAIQLDPRYDKAHFLLGLLYRETMRYPQARQHFQLALRYAADQESARKARTWLDNTRVP